MAVCCGELRGLGSGAAAPPVTRVPGPQDVGDRPSPAPHLGVDAEGERQPHGAPISPEGVKIRGNLIVFSSNFFLKGNKTIKIIFTALLHFFLMHACFISANM